MSYRYTDTAMKEMVGKKITAVHMDDEHIGFAFADGTEQVFYVWGDCCSHSYFYDFHGLDKVLANGPITEFSEIDLQPGDPGYHDPLVEVDYEYIQCYGYRIVTESDVWGEQTTAFSFRNSSNGYYGGLMEPTDYPLSKIPQLTADVLGD